MPEDREYCAAFRRWRNIRSCHAPGMRRLLRFAACARRLVDCHVGPGAGWYVKSKLKGKLSDSDIADVVKYIRTLKK